MLYTEDFTMRHYVGFSQIGSHMYVAKSLFGKQESRNHCNQIRNQAKIPIISINHNGIIFQSISLML